jgi:hypothetical protein
MSDSTIDIVKTDKSMGREQQMEQLIGQLFLKMKRTA